MKPPPRLSALRPWVKAWAIGLVAVLALAVFLDGNWLRPVLERYLSHTSQRTVRVASLHLGLDAAFQPTVRLQGVHIQNAAWADPRPMAVVGEARFTFDWKTLFSELRLVNHLVLVDARIDLERQADGLRNWRLTRPDDRGPPRIRVLALEARNSQLRFVHHGLGLLVDMATTPLPQPDGPLTQRIVFSGQYRGTPFAGDSLAGPVLSLRGTGRDFPLRGQARSGATQLEVDGHMADLLQLGRVNARVRLRGPSLAQLPFVPWPLPASQPYRVEAQLTKQQADFTLRQLRLVLGDTDASGELDYTDKAGRGAVRAVLRSQTATLADLEPLFGRGAGGTPQRQAPSPPLFSQRALRFERMNGLDAHLTLDIQTLLAPSLPPLRRVHLVAALNRGVLELASLKAELAGGQLTGRIALDSHAPARLRLELQARDVRLETLWPRLPPRAGLEGLLQAQLKLQGRGNSVAAWMGSASGALNLALTQGRLSRRLDAKLGLNGGRLLRSLVVGDRPIDIHCGALAIDFRDGIGSTRQLVLDTEQTHFEGQGRVQLRDEAWSLLLTPQAQKRTLLALRSSIQAHGNFRGFAYGLIPRSPLPPSGCAKGTAAG